MQFSIIRGVYSALYKMYKETIDQGVFEEKEIPEVDGWKLH